MLFKIYLFCTYKTKSILTNLSLKKYNIIFLNRYVLFDKLFIIPNSCKEIGIKNKK